MRILAALALVCVACEQNVHIKTSTRVSQLVIDKKELGAFGPDGKDAVIPVNFGAASYSAFDGEKMSASGLLARTHINPWSYGLSVGGAMVASPILGFGFAISVNPAWFYAPSVLMNGGGMGAFWAYLAQSASVWTFPAATLGLLIGLLPLVGLLYSERLPDVVWINTDFLRTTP